MSIEKNFVGLDGFVWWMGVVESRQDPLELGRCQIRFYGIHSDSLADIPSADLPWAIPVHSLNSHMFTTPKETDVVFGFFADGMSRQMPIMIGIIPGYQTNPKNNGVGYGDTRDLQTIRYSPKYPVSRTYNKDGSGIVVGEANTANNEVLESLRYPRATDVGNNSIPGITRYQLLPNDVINARKNNLDTDVLSASGETWSEPYPAYNPLYPFNQAVETESGHVFELDDTPRNERISMNHRSGTYWEMFPDGTKVEKVTKSNYQIIMADDHLHVMGRVYITVDSDAYIKVLGDVNVEAGNDLNAQVSGTMNLSVREALNIKAKSLNIDIENDSTLLTGGDQYFSSIGKVNIDSATGDIGITSDVGSIGILGGSAVELAGADVGINSGNPPVLASIGESSNLNSPAPRSKANDAKVADEVTPVPLQYTVKGDPRYLDATTGLAVKQNSFLNTNPADPDGPGVQPTPPAPQECNFNPTGKTFIKSSSWKLGAKGLNFIQSAEGYAEQIGGGNVRGYPDPATKAQPYTIGYGTTGPAVDQTITLDTIINKATALQYLEYAVNKKFLPVLVTTIKVDLTQEMVDACLSLIYNVGPKNFAQSSIVTKCNQKDWCGAADAFLAYNKAKGRVLNGLTTRRQSERSLFLS